MYWWSLCTQTNNHKIFHKSYTHQSQKEKERQEHLTLTVNAEESSWSLLYFAVSEIYKGLHILPEWQIVTTCNNKSTRMKWWPTPLTLSAPCLSTCRKAVITLIVWLIPVQHCQEVDRLSWLSRLHARRTVTAIAGSCKQLQEAWLMRQQLHPQYLTSEVHPEISLSQTYRSPSLSFC